MEIYSVSGLKTQYCYSVNSLQIDLLIQCNPNRNTNRPFWKTEMLILKFTWKCKHLCKMQRAKASGRLCTSSKTYCQASAARTLQDRCQTARQTQADPQPERSPHLRSKWLRAAQAAQWGRPSLSDKGREQPHTHTPGVGTQTHLPPHTTMSLRGSQTWRCKAKPRDI